MRGLLTLADGLVIALAAGFVLLLGQAAISRAGGDAVIVRAAGTTTQELPLSRNRELTVQGPLGESLIEVRDGRVRVARDPGPRQHCVRQGWISRAGESALCLPNQVSIEIASSGHDSLNY